MGRRLSSKARIRAQLAQADRPRSSCRNAARARRPAEARNCPGMSRSKDPHGRDALQRLLAPRSIALVGASLTPGSLGGRTLKNLEGFPGSVYPVNAKYQALGRWRCYPSVEGLPEPPDCVLLAVGKSVVEPALAACAARGAGGAVVFASGFAETGRTEDVVAQERLLAIARAGGMRLVGPNSAGFANLLIDARCGFPEFPAAPPPRRGMIGLVTQSGALGLALSQAAEHGAAFSHVLTCGNSCDIDVADYVAYLAEQAECGAIALAYEGLSDPARLSVAAQRAQRNGKHVVVCKLGLSEVGASTARRHTGADAGCVRSFRALCLKSGMVAVERIETLVETASFLAKAPKPGEAAGVAVASGSGGTAILAADAAARSGVTLPTPGGQTLARLAAALPGFAAAANPCDASAQVAADPALMKAVAEALLSDPAYGALVVPWGKAYRSDNIAFLGEAALRFGKPVCLVWMSQWLEGPGAREAEESPGLALFRSLDACFAALDAWHRSGRPRSQPIARSASFQ
ncbi:MAG: CoA-binding protein [Alphaproteobacteria bacterium]|nr:CoA-binding protein [Alphaproteobacteria bacterium]